MTAVTEWPAQTGKVAIVTGSNTGIGEVAARELARAGAHVYLACRSVPRAQDAQSRILTAVPDAQVEVLPLDLSSLESVRDAAQAFRAAGRPLDLLINNAGLAGPRGLTTDGFELAFGTNHLGHFLFTLLLKESLLAADDARVVTVSSASHYRAKGIDWEAARRPTRSATGMPEYEVSKLANVLFSAELHRRAHAAGVKTYSLHPGVVATDIWSRSWGGKIVDLFAPLFMISSEEGARTTLHCATKADESGIYWDKEKPRKPSRLARDERLGAELWQRSIDWTGAPDWTGDGLE